MKRKIFSKLLMVALVIAAVGSFVSCKDYDDDINNLQKQIDAKAAISELTALQSTLDSKIAAAQSAATAAQAKADAAATKTSVDELKKALETAIADAKKAGTDAGTKAGEAITAANKAQETADAAAAAAKKADEDAKAALADALKTIEETYQTKADAEKAVAGLSAAIAAVKETADAAFTKAEAEKLQEQVDGLKAELEAAIDEKIDEKIKEVNNAVASVDAIWKAVTSIELVPSGYAYPGTNFTLNLLTGTEVENKFGASVSPAGDPVRNYGAATKGEIEPVTYTKGKEISLDNRVIVRVNPANAELNKEDITLINSLGESLDEYVEVKNIADYNQLITRADVATGLKVITFARKAGVTDDQLAAATEGAKVNTKNPQPVNGLAVYAVGVKSGENDRVLYTTFDLDVWYGPYAPVTALDFEVKGDAENQNWTAVNLLKNRWNNNLKKLVGEDETKESPVADKWYAELLWQNLNDKDIKAADRYTVDTLTANKKQNYTTGDDRTGRDYVVVDEDTRTFNVSLSRYAAGAMTYPQNSRVQYYYVVLDKFAAVESAPSEYEAWASYTIKGLNEITPACDPLKITIESEAAIGDIIGFRVIAVNYDGSLVDPDGRSFYVVVGTPAAAATPKITASYLARFAAGAVPANWNTAAGLPLILADAKRDVRTTYNCGLTPVNLGLKGDIKAAEMSGTINIAAKKDVASGAVAVQYWLLKDKNGAVPANASEINFILVSVKEVGKQVDGKTGTDNAVKFTVTDPDHHNAKVAEVKIEVTKNMPSTPDFKWNASREPVGGLLTLYPNPSTDGTTLSPWNVSAGTITHAVVTPSQYTNIAAAGYVMTIKKPNTVAGGAPVLVAQGDMTTRLAVKRSIKEDNNVGEAVFGTAYDAQISFDYAGIHCAYPDYDDEDGDGDKTDDITDAVYQAQVAGVNKVAFVDALDPSVQTYTVKPYKYYTSANANVTAFPADLEKENVSSEYFIHYPSVNLQKWDTPIANPANVPVAANVAGDIWALFSSANSGNMVEVGSGKMFAQATMSIATANRFYAIDNWLNTAQYAVKVISDGTEYYTGTLNAGTGALTLVKKAGIVPPAADLDANIFIYAIDAFGLNTNKATSAVPTAGADEADWKVIATLPIKLYKN